MAKNSAYWALKKQFEGKFPIDGSAIFDIWYNRITEPYHWGYWREDAFGEGQRHGNTDQDFNRGWAKRLTKSQLYKHFLARKKTELSFYVSAGGNLLNGERLIVPMFDIDDKTHSGQSALVFERLKAAMPMVSFYSCPSTSGWGIHAYACLGFPANWNRQEISEALGWLGDRLRVIINDGSSEASFDRITGTPWYRTVSGEVVRGLLGKVPSIESDSDVRALHSALCQVTSWSEIADAVGLEELEAGEGEQADAAPLKLSVQSDSCSGSSADGGRETEEGECGDTEQLAGSNCSGPEISSLPVKDIDTLRVEPNTLARRQGFAFKLCRLAGHPLRAVELIEGYEASGLATGPRTPARTANFRQIAEYIAQNFDPTKTTKGFKPNLDLARQLLDSKLTEQAVAQEYGRQINRSKLTKEDVAVVYAMYLTFSSRKEIVAIARIAAHSFSQELKEEGLIDRTIDHKRFAAAKRILQDLGLLTAKYKARKGSSAAGFKVSNPATPRVTPSAEPSASSTKAARMP